MATGRGTAGAGDSSSSSSSGGGDSSSNSSGGNNSTEDPAVGSTPGVRTRRSSSRLPNTRTSPERVVTLVDVPDIKLPPAETVKPHGRGGWPRRLHADSPLQPTLTAAAAVAESTGGAVGAAAEPKNSKRVDRSTNSYASFLDGLSAHPVAAAPAAPSYLRGKEAELYRSAMAGVPPEAAFGIIKAIQQGVVPRDPAWLSQQIRTVLELSREFPDLKPEDLLVPSVLRLQAELLRTNTRLLKRVLPDTPMEAGLLQLDARLISRRLLQLNRLFMLQLDRPLPARMLVQHLLRLIRVSKQSTAVIERRIHGLIDLLGKERAAMAVSRNSGLLHTTTATLRRRIANHQLALGSSAEQATDMLLRHPTIVGGRVSDLQERCRVLAGLLGMPEELLKRKAHTNPGMLRVLGQRPRVLRDNFEALQHVLGMPEASLRTALRYDPQLLAASPGLVKLKLQLLAQALDTPVEVLAKKMRYTALQVLVKTVSTLRSQLDAMAAALQLPLAEVKRLVTRKPALLTLSSRAMAARVQYLSMLAADARPINDGAASGGVSPEVLTGLEACEQPQQQPSSAAAGAPHGGDALRHADNASSNVTLHPKTRQGAVADVRSSSSSLKHAPAEAVDVAGSSFISAAAATEHTSSNAHADIYSVGELPSPAGTNDNKCLPPATRMVLSEPLLLFVSPARLQLKLRQVAAALRLSPADVAAAVVKRPTLLVLSADTIVGRVTSSPAYVAMPGAPAARRALAAALALRPNPGSAEAVATKVAQLAAALGVDAAVVGRWAQLYPPLARLTPERAVGNYRALTAMLARPDPGFVLRMIEGRAGILALLPSTLQRKWQRLRDASDLHPAWQQQLRNMTPRNLVGCLTAADAVIGRLQVVAQQQDVGCGGRNGRAALSMANILRLSPSQFVKRFGLEGPEELDDRP